MNIVKKTKKDLKSIKIELSNKLITGKLTEKELNNYIKRIEETSYFIARFEVESNYIETHKREREKILWRKEHEWANDRL